MDQVLSNFLQKFNDHVALNRVFCPLGVTPDDHMMKVETVHCSACSVYVPALHSSVQLHLKSSDHSKSKLVRMPLLLYNSYVIL